MEEALTKILEAVAPVKSYLLAFVTAYIAALAAQHCITAATMAVGKVLDFLAYLKGKSNENRFLSKVEADDFIIDRLIEAVQHTQDTLVLDLKDKSEDGKLTPDEAKAASKAAYDTFMATIGQQDWNDLLAVMGDDLKNIIEAKIPVLLTSLKLTNLLPKAKAVEVTDPIPVDDGVASDPYVA